MASGIPSLPPDIVSKTGPRLLGYLFHWGLFGVLSAQVYIYNVAFPADPGRNKFFVYIVYFLEVIQTTIITASAFHVFGMGFGNYSFYDNVDLAWLSVPVISGLVAFLAGTFYAYRISILAQSNWVPGVIVLLATIQLAGSIAQAVETKAAGLFSKLLSTRFSITTAFWNGGSALCDVIIALCMTFYLSRRGAELGMPSTQRMLRRVVTLVIGSGIVTASMAIVNLILTAFPGHPEYFVVSAEILAKVYSNSMMVLLNRRIEIRSETDTNPENPRWSLFHPEIRIEGIGMTMHGLTHSVTTSPQHIIEIIYDNNDGQEMRPKPDKVQIV